MNYRAILNPDYNFVGLILIAILMMILLLLHRNIKYTVSILGKTFFTTGILMLVLAFILNFALNIIIPYEYKIFIEVISKNVFQYCIFYSGLCIIIGAFGYACAKIFKKEKQVE